MLPSLTLRADSLESATHLLRGATDTLEGVTAQSIGHFESATGIAQTVLGFLRSVELSLVQLQLASHEAVQVGSSIAVESAALDARLATSTSVNLDAAVSA